MAARHVDRAREACLRLVARSVFAEWDAAKAMQFGFDPAPAAGLGQPLVEPVQGLVDPAFVFGDLVKPVDAADLALWARIEDSRKAVDFEGYLRRFPRGCFA